MLETTRDKRFPDQSFFSSSALSLNSSFSPRKKKLNRLISLFLFSFITRTWEYLFLRSHPPSSRESFLSSSFALVERRKVLRSSLIANLFAFSARITRSIPSPHKKCVDQHGGASFEYSTCKFSLEAKVRSKVWGNNSLFEEFLLIGRRNASKLVTRFTRLCPERIHLSWQQTSTDGSRNGEWKSCNS